MARKLIKVKVSGKHPGDVNNTEITGSGTFYKLTNSSTPGAGSMYDTHKPLNGLNPHGVPDNITGGVDSDPSVIRFFFDRNSQTTTGVVYEAIINIWPISEIDEGLTALTAKMSFINDSTTDTSEEIGNRFMKALRVPGHQWTLPNGLVSYDFWFDQNGNSVNGNEYFKFVNESDSEVAAVYSYNSGYAMRVKTQNWNYGVSGSINVYGKISLKKFENQPAYTVGDVDIITKDVDFGYPGIKKNIYKVIVTYKAPVDMSADNSGSSGIIPKFAINGKMRLSPDKLDVDWKQFSVGVIPSTAANPLDQEASLGWDARHKSVELKAKDMNDWKNVYSLCLRFLSKQSQSCKGFEIEDISIIYRLKSPR